METTTSVPTDGASRLADAAQVQPTPGAWYASRKRAFVMTDNSVVIAEVRGRPEQEANCLLMAAAREMLAALKPLSFCDPRQPPYGVVVEDWSAAVEAARKAVAKAIGRTP